MLPWIQLDRTIVPGGTTELRLMQRGSEFSIMAGPIELMNSRLRGSEEALARLSYERIAAAATPHVLIGGLGMGFTLRAALAARQDARITVAELVPAVVAWARGPLAELFAGSLDDPRVTTRIGDVGEAIRAGRGSYDAILLDVDNGPDGLSRDSNDALYTARGLKAAHAALRPGGVLAVWSSGPDESFTTRLRQAGFAVELLKVRANGNGRGARHVIWMARVA